MIRPPKTMSVKLIRPPLGYLVEQQIHAMGPLDNAFCEHRAGHRRVGWRAYSPRLTDVPELGGACRSTRYGPLAA